MVFRNCHRTMRVCWVFKIPIFSRITKKDRKQVKIAHFSVHKYVISSRIIHKFRISTCSAFFFHCFEDNWIFLRFICDLRKYRKCAGNFYIRVGSRVTLTVNFVVWNRETLKMLAKADAMMILIIIRSMTNAHQIFILRSKLKITNLIYHKTIMEKERKIKCSRKLDAVSTFVWNVCVCEQQTEHILNMNEIFIVITFWNIKSSNVFSET